MRRRFRLLAAAALAAILPAAGAPPSAAAGGREEFRIAFLGPMTGPLAKAAEETLEGARLAAADRNDRGGVAGRTVVLEVVDHGDEGRSAGKAMVEVLKKKVHAVLAVTTSPSVESLTDVARRARTPVILTGFARPRAVPDRTDPVAFLGPWPVDQAMEMANLMAIHFEKPHLGLYADTLEPAVIAEDSPAGREFAAAVARNLGARQHLAGTVLVPPRGKPDPAALAALREAKCDRLVLAGEPDLLDAVAEARAALSWDVPLLCADGMLSAAAASVAKGTTGRANFMLGLPKMAYRDGRPPLALRDRYGEIHGDGSPIFGRTVNGFFAVDLLCRAGEKSRTLTGPEAIEALRAVSYGEDEWGMPVFDDAGYADVYHWYPWWIAEKGLEPVKPTYLPTSDLGTLLRMRRPEQWDAVPIQEDTKILWLSFGEPDARKPRTIEKDMGEMGIGTRGYEGDMDAWLLDELKVRTLGKLNRLFLKNYDGTFVPGVSYNIHFTFTKPEHLKPHEYWKATIAGDDDEAGGRAWPGDKRIEIYSTYMYRTNEDFHSKQLKPKMNREDKKYLDGSYAWGSTEEENVRSGRIRAIVDGYASFFALTGAHEMGHCTGLGHDRESDRSIMNVVEGAGARDTQCWFIPAHTKVVEKFLGRYEEPRRR